MPIYEESLKILEELARANPEVSLWQGLIALSLYKLARLGVRPEAHYTRALKLLEELEKRNAVPATVMGLREEIESRLKSQQQKF